MFHFCVKIFNFCSRSQTQLHLSKYYHSQIIFSSLTKKNVIFNSRCSSLLTPSHLTHRCKLNENAYEEKTFIRQLKTSREWKWLSGKMRNSMRVRCFISAVSGTKQRDIKNNAIAQRKHKLLSLLVREFNFIRGWKQNSIKIFF